MHRGHFIPEHIIIVYMYIVHVTIALGYCMGACRSMGVLEAQNLVGTPGGGWC